MLDVPLSPALPPGIAVGPSVVLLDGRGRPCGVAPKHTVHHRDTPLHLAFSCYVVDTEDRVLLTRRASTKRTWPATWTNSCCGHPQPGETLRQAVRRHLWDELGVEPTALAVALADFRYRAVMDDGTVEHEVCPVVVATVDRPVTLHPDEVDDAAWWPWPALVERAVGAPATLSPWSVRQVVELDSTVGNPARLVATA